MTALGETGAELEVDSILDGGKANLFHFVVLGVVALGFALEGLAAQAFGLALPALSHAWHLPRAAFATSTAVGLVGFALGAAAAGYGGDRLGRRTILIVSIGLFGAATAATGLAHNLTQLGCVRFATGLGLGGSIPVAAALMAELSPARWRRLAIALGFMCLPLGGFVSGMMASQLLPTRGWSGLFIACGALALALGVLVFILLPESPSYLALRPDRRDELDRLLRRLGLTSPPPAASASRARWADLFAREVRSQTLVLLATYFFLLLGMYLIFSWGPSVLNSRGLSLAQASEALSAFALGGVFAGPVSGWTTQALGPKRAAVLLGVLAVAAAAGLSWLCTRQPLNGAAVMGGVFLLGHAVSGVQTALYALAAEIYPAHIRSSGVGAAVAAGRIGAVLSSYLGVFAIGLGGASSFFLFVAGALVLSMGATLFAKRTPT